MSGSRPRALVGVLFALLVASSFAAFFVAQRLKRQPSVVASIGFSRFISPNDDGLRESARLSFALRRSERVDVTVVDDNGNEVRELASNVSLAPHRPLRLRWNGRDADGRVPADGLYRFRIFLREEGRTILSPRSVTLDTTPPEPRVRSVGPTTISPDGDGRNDTATIDFSAPASGRAASGPPLLTVWRTDLPVPRHMAEIRGRRGQHQVRWDGMVNGRPAPAGTYLVAITARDAAGNLGRQPPTRVPDPDRRGAGRPGVRVRYVDAAAPQGAAAPGERVPFTINTDQRSAYTWRVVPIGRVRSLSHGTSHARGPRTLGIRAPREPGMYALVLQGRRGPPASIPFAVGSARPGRLLVALPLIAWHAVATADDDADGWDQTLNHDGSVRLDAPFPGGRLPRGLSGTTSSVVDLALSQTRRAELTTDVALARGQGRDVLEVSGLLFAGGQRWATPDLLRRLASAVRAGTRVGWMGPDSFHRRISLDKTRIRLDGRARRDEGLLGERTTLERGRTTLEVGRDRLGLFAAVVPRFGLFRAIERTLQPPKGARLAAGAGPPRGGLATPAWRVGRGLAIRLNPDPISAELRTRRDVRLVVTEMVRLLARGPGAQR